jgi:hypothetical protein
MASQLGDADVESCDQLGHPRTGQRIARDPAAACQTTDAYRRGLHLMNFAKFAAAAAALAIMPAAAMAQDAGAAAPAAPAATVEIAEGAAVMGNDGVPIGTVIQVAPEAVVVDTGLHQIPLPRDAFGEGETGLTLNITKTDLDATYAEQMAAANAQLATALVAGAPVVTADAQPLGAIDTIEGENVVLNLASAEKLTLGKDVFALDANGALMVRATMAQIEQARAGAAAPASAEPAAPAAPTAG